MGQDLYFPESWTTPGLDISLPSDIAPDYHWMESFDSIPQFTLPIDGLTDSVQNLTMAAPIPELTPVNVPASTIPAPTIATPTVLVPVAPVAPIPATMEPIAAAVPDASNVFDLVMQMQRVTPLTVKISDLDREGWSTHVTSVVDSLDMPTFGGMIWDSVIGR